MRRAFLLVLVLAACARTPAPPLLRSPGVEHPESAGFRVLDRIEKDPRIPATDFTLIDQNEASISLSDLRGKVVMMTFLYTNCPEACPLVAGNFVNTKKQIAERPDADDLIQILVSTDPEHDTPDRLSVYTRGIGGDWHFLTGELEEVAQIWKAYNIYREVQDRNEAVVVYHDYRTYLIDPEGMIRYEHIGVWYPRDIVPDVEKLLDEF
jgi:protein SCO1/2